MERKSARSLQENSKAWRKRPQQRHYAAVRAVSPETHSEQSSMELHEPAQVFASVHRPRQALKRPTVQHIAVHQTSPGRVRDVTVLRTVDTPPTRMPQNRPQGQNFNQIPRNATSLLSNIYEKHLLNQTTFEGATEPAPLHFSLSMQQRQLMAIIASRRDLFVEPKQPLYEVIDTPQVDSRPPPKPRIKPPIKKVMEPSVRIDPVGGNLAPEPVELGCIFNSVGQRFEYRNTGRTGVHLEALYPSRTSQGHKMMSNGQGLHKSSRATEILNSTDRGGFCGALQRTPPSMPAAISRRLANRENAGIGKVKVMLRIADNPAVSDEGIVSSYLTVDKKKRQVTLSDPNQASLAAASHPSSSQERGPMVAAPKMFAFDGLFTPEDAQSDLCSGALSEVIPAVLDGSDGCLLALGYPGAGQSKSMMGSIGGAGDLGAIPCAISWLYRGINERRQKSGARFSVRVSALGVNATKPGSASRDLLAAHATESDESPGVYLRDDFLGGPTELRAPTAERAALFLDTALAGRVAGHTNPLEPALIFTLHVYQYSLAGKGGVAGGRSRLHLIDLGGCANRAGGLPLSGIGNVLLAILSGQRHPPNRDHPLTPLLKDCLAPITCHVTVLAHVTHSQSHSDALTTIQLASRIHRMRRRKHRFQLSGGDKGGVGLGGAGHQSGGSSEGPDPSSSDLSADTVIYMGPCDEQTDGEHPPVYLPSLSSGDNRCAMQKVLKGTVAEKPSKSPAKKLVPQSYQPSPNTITTAQRTDSLKKVYEPGYQNTTMSPVKQKLPTSPYKYPMSLNKASNVPTPKGSPMRRPNMVNSPHESPVRKVTEEKWIDGPRVSRSKVAEARHLMREINHVKQCETWVDGPKTTTPQSTSKTLVAGCLPGSMNHNGAYGFMDSHKKTMIRQWVENQTSQMMSSGHQLAASSPSSPHHQKPAYHMTQFKCSRSEDDQRSLLHETGAKKEEENHSEHTANTCPQPTTAGIENQEEEDQDSGPSEVPPALPLIDRLGSREISHESLHLGSSCSRHISRENLPGVQMMDCGLQVTEEEIARTMGVGVGATDHPLSALSHGDMSIVSSFHVGDTFSDCVIGDNSRHQFDQLARLREIFTSQLAMAEVTPVFRVGGDAGSVYSEPAYRFNGGTGSVCSEPVCRAPSPRCRDCRQSITLSRSPSQTSLPSLNGIVTIAGMEQYASLRHPDGASDPNLQKTALLDQEDKKPSPIPAIDDDCGKMMADTPLLSQTQLPQLPPLPLSTSEAYDSGHDSTPRTSKHSGISRRAESGYHSVATVRDSDESSFSSAAGSKVPPRESQKIHAKKSKRTDKSLCHWLRSPFTCTYPDTEGEVSDF